VSFFNIFYKRLIFCDFNQLPYVTSSSVPENEVVLMREALKMTMDDKSEEVVKARKDLLIDGFNFKEKEISAAAYDDHVQQVLSDVTRMQRIVQSPSTEEMEKRLLDLRNRDVENILDGVRIVADLDGLGNTEKILSSGRWARIFYPGTAKPVNPWLNGASIDCVAFFGERPNLYDRMEDDSEMAGRCIVIDDDVMEKLDQNIIRGYFSFNQIGQQGGNSFNLVVFQEGHDASTLGHALGEAHSVGIRDVACNYYSRVRIYRCRVSKNTVDVFRTLAVEYYKGKIIYRNAHSYD
jgi:hypothetical protein